MAEAKIRSFLAVELAPDVHAALVRLRRELAESGAAVRWTRDEGLHVTVKFLGSVETERLEALRTALGEVLTGVPRFAVRVAGLGAFPSLQRARVLWVGVAGAGLERLAAAVESTAAGHGFAVERRAFRGHVTLGRVKGPRGWSRLAEIVRARADLEMGGCTVGELIGYRSDLRPDGAVYTKLWAVPLATPGGG